LPEYIIAADWFIFYLLSKERRLFFDKKSVVFYRQHQNIAGKKFINSQDLQKIYEVRNSHFRGLNEMGIDSSAKKKQNDEIFQNLNRILDLDAIITSLGEDIFHSSFWWEELDIINNEI